MATHISERQIICWQYPHLKFMSGGTRFLLNVGEYCVQHQLRFRLICNLGDPKIIQTFQEAGIEVVTTSFWSTNDAFYWLSFPLQLLWDTFRTWQLSKDADYLTATLFPANVITALVAKIKHQKYFYYSIYFQQLN